MRAELKRLHRQFGMTIVYATPDELEALSMGEEIAVMRDGAVVQSGTPDELYETPRDLYVAGKIGSPHMNMIEAQAGRRRRQPSRRRIGPLPFATQAAMRQKPARRHVVGIRPSDVRARGGGRSRLQGRRRTCSSRWATSPIVSVEAGGETLRMVLPEAAALRACKPGEQASIILDPSKIHIFRAVERTGDDLTRRRPRSKTVITMGGNLR